MADLIRLPGGHLYPDPDDGMYVLARDMEAIQRGEESLDMQLMDRFGAAETYYARFLVELAEVRSAGGLGPASPVDGQTAALLGGEGTLTRAALVREMLRMASPIARPSAGGMGPRVVSEVELFRDTAGRTGDGAKFFTAVQMGGVWHGYVSGHNSKEIWHLTSADLLAGWSWDQPVIACPQGSAPLVQSQAGDHVASPHAALGPDGQIHLTYHGPLASNGLEQPTFKAKSANGTAFSSLGVYVPTEYANEGSPYRTSTSYVTSVWHDGVWHAIWQGTTGRQSDNGGGAYAPMPVGYATSADGVSVTKHHPIIPAPPGDQGLLAPGLVRLTDGWLVVGAYRAQGGAVRSVAAFMGETLESLHRVRDIVLPGANRPQWINSPSFFYRDGRMWMVGGVESAQDGTPCISAFELDWSQS